MSGPTGRRRKFEAENAQLAELFVVDKAGSRVKPFSPNQAAIRAKMRFTRDAASLVAWRK
jgi:hypothetical protein